MSGHLDQEFRNLQHGDHICPIHQSTAEQTSSAVLFASIGLEQGERCIYVADDSTQQDLAREFAARGVDLDGEQKKGSLTISRGRETYLRSGQLVAQQMIDFLAKSEREALDAGYSGLRFQGEMTWALDADSPDDGLIGYEAGLGTYLKSSHAVVACHYLRERLNATAVHDVLVTHPLVVIAEQTCPNPYYAPAELLHRPAPIARSDFKRKRIGWSVAKLQAALIGEQRSANANQTMNEQQDLIQHLLDSTDEAIYGLDLDGKCIFANPNCARLLGYSSAADLTGRNMHHLIHHHHADGRVYTIDECPIYQTLATQKRAHCGDDVFWHPDGSPVCVEYWAYPMWHGDALIGAVVSFLDISQKKALEEQLRKSQKMEEVGRLAGGVAHDFNNLLTIITGYSELLLSLTPKDDPKWKYIEQIRNAGERSASLTRQLLVLSRKQVLAPKVLNLNGVIGEMENMLRRVIGEDVQLTIDLNPELHYLNADPSQLEHVLLNLMINARDAMPQGGVLKIETDNVVVDDSAKIDTAELPNGRYIRLSVKDSGAGMTDFVKNQLFEPFFTTKTEGTGLGLSVVHGIVTQCGGHIAVESNPGEGTALHIYLPETEPMAPINNAEGERGVSSRGGETILLVEDEDAVRNLARLTLEECGYTVLEARNASEAFQICAGSRTQIHLLVTDVVMPETSGPVLAEKLSYIYPQMRILFVSGYTDGAVERHGILHKQVNFLQKPFSLTTLTQKVKEVLASS
jgi:two-component system, cell cycle sensor histidine kinase and response regulator CckA